jgi:hypothetical protein
MARHRPARRVDLEYLDRVPIPSDDYACDETRGWYRQVCARAEIRMAEFDRHPRWFRDIINAAGGSPEAAAAIVERYNVRTAEEAERIVALGLLG